MVAADMPVLLNNFLTQSSSSGDMGGMKRELSEQVSLLNALYNQIHCGVWDF